MIILLGIRLKPKILAEYTIEGEVTRNPIPIPAPALKPSQTFPETPENQNTPQPKTEASRAPHPTSESRLQ